MVEKLSSQSSENNSVEKKNPVAERMDFINSMVTELQDEDVATKSNVLRVIMAESFKDGFELAEALGLPNDEIFRVVASYAPYPDDDVQEDIVYFLDLNKQYLSFDHQARYQELKGKYYSGLRSPDDGMALRRIGSSAFILKGSIRDKIMDYYVPFISRHRLRAGEHEFDNSRGADSALELFQYRKLERERHFYTGPIADYMKQKYGPDFEVPGFITAEAYISEEHLKEFLGDLPFDQFEAAGALKYKEPWGLLSKIKKENADKELRKELTKSLIARGFKEGDFVIEQGADGKMVVVDKREGVKSAAEGKETTPGGFDFDVSKFDKTIVDLGIEDGKPVPILMSKVVGDKLAFVIRGIDGQTQLFLGSELQYQGDREVDYIEDVGGKIVFVTDAGNLGFRLDAGGWTVSGKQISDLSVIGNKLAYVVGNREGFSDPGYAEHLVWEGQTFSKEYLAVTEPIGIDGKLFFIAKISENTFQVVSDGIAVSDQFPYIYGIQNISGKLAFVARGADDFFRVIHDGKPVSPEYYHIGQLTEVAGKPAFVVADDRGVEGVVWDQTHIGDVYDDVSELQEINGKPAFIARKGRNSWVVYNGINFGLSYYDVEMFELKEIGGEINFTVRSRADGKLAFVHGRAEPQDRRYRTEYLNRYVSKTPTQELGGKPVFIAEMEYGKYKVIYDGHPLDEWAFDHGVTLEIKSGTLVIAGMRGAELYTYSIKVEGDSKPAELTLNEEEKGKLELLNYVHGNDPTAEAMTLMSHDSGVNSQEDFYSSPGVLSIVNDAIKESAGTFFGQIKAKHDNIRQWEIEKIANKLFPEIRVNQDRERARNRRLAPFGRSSSGDRDDSEAPAPKPEDYLSQQDSFEVFGGDPERADDRPVVEFRKDVEGMLISQIALSCNAETGVWNKTEIPLSTELHGMTEEISATVPSVGSAGELVLPRFLDGNVIPERLRGVDRKGQEVVLPFVKDQAGFVRVTIPRGIEKILYSQEREVVASVPEDISQAEYEKFRNDFLRKYGTSALEKVADLPDEVRVFVDSLKMLSPLQKLLKIEEFIKSICYYDFDNKAMMPVKKGKGNDDRLAIMESRMWDIRQKDRDQTLTNKKYAGVCADFAVLTTGALRYAGFVSGISNGIKVSGRTAMVSGAHSNSSVIWPTPDGKYEVVSIDGTPDGTNAREQAAINQLRTKSLSERLAENKTQSDQLVKKMEDKLGEIEKILADYDLDKIKTIANGELETVLNIILRYKVKQPHLKIIDTILNAARYSGQVDVAKVDLADPTQQLEVLKFFESEIKRERERVEDNRGVSNASRGKDFFELVTDFVERYKRDHNDTDFAPAIEKIERIFRLVEKSLDPIESRAAFAVINYLKAKKMLSSK